MRLGLRFDESFAGPGKKVREVIPGGPADLRRSRIEPGEVILSVDGEAVGPDSDWRGMLTMDTARDLELQVKSAAGEERTVTIRPTSSVRRLLYDEFVENNRAAVEEMSDGKLGYLHIQGMNMGSFRRFEEELFEAGHGKDGIIIDVRFNGGGSTTDHVMTALTQPRHAITVARESGRGYPQDRKVYASWHKPVVLMCNEYSFSNAEILSHAVKQAGRGPLVGMRTAGGVISTGAAGLADGSRVRMPFRGWYVLEDGQDMELNGCIPHHAMWNPPGGPDLQLQKAVSVLEQEVAAAPKDPEPIIRSSRGE